MPDDEQADNRQHGKEQREKKQRGNQRLLLAQLQPLFLKDGANFMDGFIHDVRPVLDKRLPAIAERAAHIESARLPRPTPQSARGYADRGYPSWPSEYSR